MFMRPGKKTSGCRGQGLVEFALVIPIFLFVVIGLIEAGRAVFIYAAVVNASREAARYGSAAGVNNAGIPLYQDCAGIRNTAKQIAFLANVQDADVVIEITQPDGGVEGLCDDADGVEEGLEVESLSRITVTVSAMYSPIIPIIPLEPQEFESSSTRTFTGIIQLNHPPPAP